MFGQPFRLMFFACLAVAVCALGTPANASNRGNFGKPRPNARQSQKNRGVARGVTRLLGVGKGVVKDTWRRTGQRLNTAAANISRDRKTNESVHQARQAAAVQRNKARNNAKVKAAAAEIHVKRLMEQMERGEGLSAKEVQLLNQSLEQALTTEAVNKRGFFRRWKKHTKTIRQWRNTVRNSLRSETRDAAEARKQIKDIRKSAGESGSYEAVAAVQKRIDRLAATLAVAETMENAGVRVGRNKLGRANRAPEAHKALLSAQKEIKALRQKVHYEHSSKLTGQVKQLRSVRARLAAGKDVTADQAERAKIAVEAIGRLQAGAEQGLKMKRRGLFRRSQDPQLREATQLAKTVQKLADPGMQQQAQSFRAGLKVLKRTSRGFRNVALRVKRTLARGEQLSDAMSREYDSYHEYFDEMAAGSKLGVRLSWRERRRLRKALRDRDAIHQRIQARFQVAEADQPTRTAHTSEPRPVPLSPSLQPVAVY